MSPRVGALELAGQPKQRRFVAEAADEVGADGQAVVAGCHRHRHRRLPGGVGEHREADAPAGTVEAALALETAEGQRWHRRSWGQQHVDIGEEPPDGTGGSLHFLDVLEVVAATLGPAALGEQPGELVEITVLDGASGAFLPVDAHPVRHRIRRRRRR